MTKKMTKKDYFQILRDSYPQDAANYADVIAFIDHEVALLAKKNSGDSKKPTKVQQENEAFKSSILNFLAHCVGPVTATEVMNGCSLSSNQKAAALLRALKDEGKVEKFMDKGKSVFKLV